MEDHARADIHTVAHKEPHRGAGGYFLKKPWLMEIPFRSIHVCSEALIEEERETKRNCCRLTITPLSILPASLKKMRGRGVENEDVNLILGKGLRRNVLIFLFLFFSIKICFNLQ